MLTVLIICLFTLVNLCISIKKYSCTSFYNLLFSLNIVWTSFSVITYSSTLFLLPYYSIPLWLKHYLILYWTFWLVLSFHNVIWEEDMEHQKDQSVSNQSCLPSTVVDVIMAENFPEVLKDKDKIKSKNFKEGKYIC